MTDAEPDRTDPSKMVTDPPVARRRRRALRIIAIVVLVLVLLGLAAPTLLSSTVLAAQVERALGDALATRVRVADASVGWFSGLSVEGLAIENPAGFPAGAPCIEFGMLEGSVSLTALLGGRVDLRGRVTGCTVRVFQRDDGTLNLEALGRSEAPIAAPEPSPAGPRRTPLDDVRLDLALENGTVEVDHETHGRIERITNLDARIASAFGSSDFALTVGADVGDTEPGRIDVAADVDATLARPIAATVAAARIDLGRYRPLLVARLPDRIEQLDGTLDGELRITVRPDGETAVAGELRVSEPRIAGPIVGGLDVRAPAWRIDPALTTKDGAFDASGVQVDLGFLTARGIAPARAAELCGGDGVGLELDVDVAQLVALGVPLPAGLETRGLRVGGALALREPGTLESFTPEAILGALGLDAEVSADHLAWAGRTLSGLRVATRVRDGVLTARSADGAQLDGGALQLTARVDLNATATAPTEASVTVRGAHAGGSAVHGLRFAIPLLAGIAPEQANIDFRSDVDLELAVRGPALRGEGQTVLEWLDAWSGSGAVGLRNGGFTPAPQLAGLLELAGQRQRLTFDDLTSSFELAAGAISTEAVRFAGRGQEFELRGRTELSGEIDYTIDLASWLRGRSDGEKVLQYVDPKTLSASLGGTLDAPRLGLPDVAAMIQSAAQKAIETEARKQADRALRDLFDRLRR